MSTKRIFISCVVGWPIVVVTALAGRLALLDGPSAAELVGWVFMTTAPVLTVLIIARGRSAQSIGQVLYDVEHAGNPDQRSGR